MDPAANSSAQQILGQQSAETQELLNTFWERVHTNVRDVVRSDPEDFKSLELPLARIKKIMKLDEDVHGLMISQEAPVVFAKAAEIFISELTLGAWVHTEENRRRTIQRCDIAQAIANYDQFDFLIDIVPREELRTSARITKQQPSAAAVSSAGVQPATPHSTAMQQQPAANLPGSNVSLALDSAGNLQYVLQIPASLVNGALQQQAIQIQLVPSANSQNQVANMNVGGLNVSGLNVASLSGAQAQQQSTGIVIGSNSFQLASPPKTGSVGTQQMIVASTGAEHSGLIQLGAATTTGASTSAQLGLASPSSAAAIGRVTRKSDAPEAARRMGAAATTATGMGIAAGTGTGKAIRDSPQNAPKRPAAAAVASPPPAQRGRAAAGAKVAKRK